ncbi:hypothetical protein ANANG_G00197800 [Anguilla anguilla]|uniref:Uncharacterized protein n=1 Tax=Anguilla anguilla TaxID=7936 RepID=A0A9D3RSE1_ANGAN|nr:hypothetical protein ANANG_G00197800 [Anguilla anguilla]
MDLRKSVRKTLLTLARAALPTLGFGFTCLGAFLLSTRGAGNSCAPYICIVLGFVLLTAGVVWTICVSVRSRVLRQRQRRRQRRGPAASAPWTGLIFTHHPMRNPWTETPTLSPQTLSNPATP